MLVYCTAMRFTVLILAVAIVDSVHLPEEDMNAIQLIENQGYVGESHSVVTEDGYILGMQRIPHGSHETQYSPRPCVLLQHGLTASSTNFVTNLANESLAFLLADAGYDVWLGNVRGNVYSMNHVSLNSKDPKFWKFSWDEMAAYDLPAMVDYMLGNTGQPYIYYVGHSQGTLIAFAKLSSDLEFAKKIKVFFALAPVSTVGFTTSNIRYLAPFTGAIMDVLNTVGDVSLGQIDWILNYVKPLCDNAIIDSLLCTNALELIMGPEKSFMLNQTRWPVYIAHNPSGTSMKDVAHFGQMIKSKKMAKFDYGPVGNLLKYHSLKPPVYDVSKMQTHCVLFWSEFDVFADQNDVKELLPKIHHYEAHKLDNYSHLDFLWALNAKTDIYDRIMNTIRRYENGDSL